MIGDDQGVTWQVEQAANIVRLGVSGTLFVVFVEQWLIRGTLLERVASATCSRFTRRSRPVFADHRDHCRNCSLWRVAANRDT